MVKTGRASAPLIVFVLGLVLSSPAVTTAAQEPINDVAVSLDRVREAVQKTPTIRLTLDMPPARPAATFKVHVEQRTYMLTFEEQLHKLFDLTPLQRQSQDWASKCCGLDLDALMKPISRALQRRKERRIRERIARDLAELTSAADRK